MDVLKAPDGHEPPEHDAKGEAHVRLGRRWDDRPGTIPALTFARFLTTQPTVPEAMRFLVGLLSWPLSVYGALLICPHEDGFTICSRFEESIHDTAVSPASAELEQLVAEIVHATQGSHPVLWTEPDDPAQTPLAAWPLGFAEANARVLVVLLAAHSDPVVVAERTVGLAEALAVYLAGAHADLTLPRRALLPSPVVVDLSRRQLRILQLMTGDLTMRQIAGRIGFSDSTVRTESLAIYRTLGVHDRASAVETARRLGLIPTPKEPMSPDGSDVTT